MENIKISQIFQYINNKDYKKVKEILNIFDPNLCDENFNNTILHQACENYDLKMVKIIIKCGAHVSILNKKYETCLDIAIKNIIDGDHELIKYLIQNGSKVDYLQKKYLIKYIKLLLSKYPENYQHLKDDLLFFKKI